MNGKIQVNSGDVSIIAVKLDDKDVTEIPQKDQNISFDRAECGNDAEGYWDNTNWEFKIRNLTKPKTKCTLYFVSNELSSENKEITQFLFNKVSDWRYADQIVYEQNGNDNNVRFIGSNPDNYIYFNCQEGATQSSSTCETWRIIGLMDNITTADGKNEKLLKIRKKDSLGSAEVWDRSESGVNQGNGVNEWSQADLMNYLNGSFFQKFNETAQSMIETVVWNTGTMDKPFDDNSYTTNYSNLINPRYMYDAERSSNHGKICSATGSYANNCNDTVERTTKWTGKVGLIYPSDYGFATSGGQLKNRNNCLERSMYSWSSDCYENDWLYYSRTWTITPTPRSYGAFYVFYIDNSGDIYCAYADEYMYEAGVVFPVMYLKANIKITGGEGTSSKPYTLALGE